LGGLFIFQGMKKILVKININGDNVEVFVAVVF